jgi:hypothetical protein
MLPQSHRIAGPGLAITRPSLILLKKRDDFWIARKFSDEFFHIIEHDRDRFSADEL